MNTTNQFIIYQFDDNDIKIDVKFDEDKETIWMSQKELSILFNTDRSTISKHISNIFNSGELLENSTCAKFAQVEKTGFFPISQKIIYYNLDVVVAVGYRVNSKVDWLRGLDLNQRPQGYEPCKLPLLYPAFVI